MSVKRESTELRKNATKQCKKVHTQTLDEVDDSYRTEDSVLTCQLFMLCSGLVQPSEIQSTQ